MSLITPVLIGAALLAWIAAGVKGGTVTADNYILLRTVRSTGTWWI